MLHYEAFKNWYDKILNTKPFILDDSSIHTVGIAWGFKENGHWNLLPRITGNDHQYYNSILFTRIGFPLSAFFQIRWLDDVLSIPPKVPLVGGKNIPELVQFGFGYKESGRIAAHLRFQTDKSAADGAHPGMPNTDQATGFNFGGH